MKLILCGYYGHMAEEVKKLAEAGYCDAEILFGVDPGAKDTDGVCARSFDGVSEAVCTDADCIVDFSHHSATSSLLSFAKAKHLPVILATTGQTEEEKSMIRAAAEEIPVFFAANYSLGIALLIELAKKTAAAFPDADIEIVEKHHNRKLDAPSGTALAIAEAIASVRRSAFLKLGRCGQSKRDKNEIGIHALRLGNVVGEHEVIVATAAETVTLRHEAHSRALFAQGALKAAAFLSGAAPGLYTMQSLINDR